MSPARTRRSVAPALSAASLALVLGDAGVAEPAKAGAAPTLVVNEVDYDQPGTDIAEYIEIKNVSGASVSLDGFVIELVNGNGGGAVVYQTIPLPPFALAPGGYYVVCGNAVNVPLCDLDVMPDINLIQNGAPDAVAIRSLTTLAIVDTVSYDGVTGPPYTEGGAGAPPDNPTSVGGISRIPDGIDTDTNSLDFAFTPILTPHAPNATPVDLQGFSVE